MEFGLSRWHPVRMDRPYRELGKPVFGISRMHQLPSKIRGLEVCIKSDGYICGTEIGDLHVKKVFYVSETSTKKPYEPQRIEVGISHGDRLRKYLLERGYEPELLGNILTFSPKEENEKVIFRLTRDRKLELAIGVLAPNPSASADSNVAPILGYTINEVVRQMIENGVHYLEPAKDTAEKLLSGLKQHLPPLNSPREYGLLLTQRVL